MDILETSSYVYSTFQPPEVQDHHSRQGGISYHDSDKELAAHRSGAVAGCCMLPRQECETIGAGRVRLHQIWLQQIIWT